MQASHGYPLDQDVSALSLPQTYHISLINTAQTDQITLNDERFRDPTHQFRNGISTSNTIFTNLRHRPRYPRIQCRWTYPPFGKSVDTCRYGKQCQYGHEGDEYYEQIGLRYRWENGERFAERYAETESTTNSQWAPGREKQWRGDEQGIWGDFDIKMCDRNDSAIMVFGKPPSIEEYSSGEESAESSGRGKKRRMAGGKVNRPSESEANSGMWTR